VFGYRYECILECSEVIDLFLFAEMSQCWFIISHIFV
jgi:hypothetical protein